MDPTNNIQNDENKSDRKLKDLFGKEMPYQVPDGYFGSLPGRTLESIRQKPVRSMFSRRGFKKIAAAAAILIFAAIVATMVFTDRNIDEESADYLSISDIYQYNFNNLADMEETYLLSLIEYDSLDLMSLMFTRTDSISDEAIMDYLLAENHIEYYIINEY